MSPYRTRVLVLLSVCAVAASVTDLLGWAAWQSASRRLATSAEQGARQISGGGLMELPSAVARSRKLAVRDLGSAPIDLAFRTLMRAGGRQRRWIVSHPSGATNLALGYLVASDPAAALDALAEALERDPTSAYLHRLKALLLMIRGEISASLESLAVAQALAPDLLEPGLDLTPENERSVRLRSLELRRELYPRQSLQTGLALARDLRAVGNIKGATAILDELEDHPEVSLERAQWALDAGDVQTAIGVLESVTSRQTATRRLRARAWSMVAVARDLEGDRERALEAARRALDLDGSSPYAFLSLAGLAERRGEYDEALEHLRRAWGMAPSDVSLLVRISGVAERAGKRSDAVFAMQRAVELDPSSPELAAHLVSLHLRFGDVTSAAITLSEALDRHPTNPSLLDLADRLRREVGIR